MKRNKLWLITLIALVSWSATAQKSKPKSPTKQPVAQQPKNKSPKTTTPPAVAPAPVPATSDPASDEKKVRDIVAFLEFVLNTLGSSTTSSRDKDVVIKESYSKIFKDAKVQIEDDLDEEREISTRKNIVAYLKDVDFFFRDVKFEFDIESIQRGEGTDHQVFYKVSLKRNIRGTNSDGKPVNNTIPRFIEINYNPADQDLKIASVYTREPDEKSALLFWWKGLSLEWQTLLKAKLLSPPSDTLDFNAIKSITALTTLDLGGNPSIRDIQPLAQLSALQTLRISNTGINDLSPIRNLTELTELDISGTRVADLSALRYADKLEKLDISHTEIVDLTILQKMPKLKHLDAGSTRLTDYTPISGLTELITLGLHGSNLQSLSSLAGLTQLSELNVAATPIQDLSPLATLKSLVILNIDSTRVSNLTPLSGLDNLTLLRANNTRIADLHPLQKLAKLEKIYCDRTPIKRPAADGFNTARPRAIVVYNSDELKPWWEKLSPEWKEILCHAAGISPEPTVEELTRLANLDSIDGGGSHVRDLNALRMIPKLRVIIVRNTSVSDLSPLNEHRAIQYLDISETEVSDITVATQFPELKVLMADKSKVENLAPLYGAKGLKKLYVDETVLHDLTAGEFLDKNPTCLLIFKTGHLNRWWSRLPREWRDVFRGQMKGDTTASRENLHHLVELEVLHFSDAPVEDLSALSEFFRLKELHFSGTKINDLTPLIRFQSLRSLHATHSPIQQIQSLNQLPGLEDLDISDTPVDALEVVGLLRNLKRLNCSGTQIKRLDPVKSLTDLEYLDCSNTRVGNLDPAGGLALKTLKCYNTKVSTREIEYFKKSKPNCSVVYYR